MRVGWEVGGRVCVGGGEGWRGKREGVRRGGGEGEEEGRRGTEGEGGCGRVCRCLSSQANRCS